MTSPIDLLTRLKAQIESLTGPVTNWAMYDDCSVRMSDLQRIRESLTELEEAIRQDREETATAKSHAKWWEEQAAKAQATVRDIALLHWPEQEIGSIEQMFVYERTAKLIERNARLEADAKLAEQRVQALEAELEARAHERKLLGECYDASEARCAELRAEVAALRAQKSEPCKRCDGRGWIMGGFSKDLGGGLSAGGSWNEPCPDCKYAAPVEGTTPLK